MIGKTDKMSQPKSKSLYRTILMLALVEALAILCFLIPDHPRGTSPGTVIYSTVHPSGRVAECLTYDNGT